MLYNIKRSIILGVPDLIAKTQNGTPTGKSLVFAKNEVLSCN
jgi:hypothetical protein